VYAGNDIQNSVVWWLRLSNQKELLVINWTNVGHEKRLSFTVRIQKTIWKNKMTNVVD